MQRVVTFRLPLCLPNLLGPLITLAIFEMTAMIFYEAGLSFIGLSVPPEVPSWGNMLQLGRRLLPIPPGFRWPRPWPSPSWPWGLTWWGTPCAAPSTRASVDDQTRAAAL